MLPDLSSGARHCETRPSEQVMDARRDAVSAAGERAERICQLMRSVREGSEDAARMLFDRYAPHIRRVVRRKLHQKLRPQFDSVDFVQDVWASFSRSKASKQALSPPRH